METPILSLNGYCRIQHKEVLDKGFEPQNVPTNLMLIVSELGEALEADRKNRHADANRFRLAVKELCNSGAPREKRKEMYKTAFETHVKDTFEDELADAFLRLMDLCGEYEIDIESHIRWKLEYNTLRPVKHGKAY